MALRRILALLTMMLLLAGCYRQADDSFQTVNSQGGETPQSIDVTPTDIVPAVDPNAGSETPTPLSDVTTLTVPDASPTVMIFVPDASPTDAGVITQQPTDEPAATDTPVEAETAPTTLPTATPPTVVTPGLGNPSQVTLPSATPTSAVTQGAGGTGLQPTPTDLGAPVPEECRYTIVSGDNLYRIALRHSVALADLLAENSLSETSIIQPGESLRIPGCDPSAASPAATATTSAAGIPQATAFPPDVTIHTVAGGETLTTIARQYGVSLQSIIDANNLTNPDRLAVGDQLMIPAQP